MLKTALTTALIASVAGTAVADRPVVDGLASADGFSVKAPALDANPYLGRNNIVTVTYNFADGSLDYGSEFDFAGNPTGYVGDRIIADVASGGFRVLGVEASGISADVNFNPGAAFENWASELRLGWDDAGFGVIGVAPFPDDNTGAATPGTSATFTGGSFPFIDLDGTTDLDGDGTIDDFFMPAAGSTVAGFATFNDGTGLAAGTVTGGTITYTLEVPAPGAAGLLGVAGLAAARRRR